MENSDRRAKTDEIPCIFPASREFASPRDEFARDSLLQRRVRCEPISPAGGAERQKKTSWPLRFELTEQTRQQQKYCDHGRSTAVLTSTWPICRAPQILRFRREAQKRIDLAVYEELDRLDGEV